MKISKEQKQSIRNYILEKIEAGQVNLSAYVAESLQVSPNTVHAYINELLAEGVIERTKRGEYRMTAEEWTAVLSRQAGDLREETYILNTYFSPHIADLPENVRRIWDYVFSEMVNNVIDHSEAELLTITCRRSHRSTRLTLSDNGVGIFRKIMDHFSFLMVEDAVCELFKGKLTTDASRHSGEGIFFSSKLVDTFFIISDGKVFSADKYDEETLSDIPTEINTTVGTTVIMELSNQSARTPEEVFNRFADPDNGYFKTILPLHQIFESPPVSRSQARRVCNRLDSFREVILDFDGIPWMGQGFAHQIFIVYQREHPMLKITPVNMCPGVEQMYWHVIKTAQ